MKVEFKVKSDIFLGHFYIWVYASSFSRGRFLSNLGMIDYVPDYRLFVRAAGDYTS